MIGFHVFITSTFPLAVPLEWNALFIFITGFLVSFLPSMRQYSGNWASAMWAFAPGREEELDKHLTKPALMQKQQLTAIYGEEAAEVVMQQLLGWRAMHSQGRGLNSVMISTLGDDIDTYTLREAEFSCNAVTGFNFGDGHLHDEHLIASIQERCDLPPEAPVPA